MKFDFKGSVVVIGAHPDDPDIWTGGMALLLRKMDIPVHFICVGKASDKHKEIAALSAEIHGIQRHYLDLEINGNPNLVSEIRQIIPPLLKDLNAEIAFIPGLTDYHQEHVDLSKALQKLFHWSNGAGLKDLEVYFYDSHEKRDPIEFYVDISSVWDTHIKALKSFKQFEHSTVPDNTLIRLKTGRAMMLGTAQPSGPALYAEGYAMVQGNSQDISILMKILQDKCSYRHPFLINNF